ncbi:Phosphoenolpyruvate-dependent sugar phosphotransferase system, EIIA 2 [Enterococcus mundtii]|nr:Phosphoenolpyruvate-dependent sugar phosphotransferase system, EIIA 2 [Enterococcus mundtii]
MFQVPDGVDFGIDEEKKVATILFAVIMRENQQLTSLQELAFFCSDVDQVMALSDAQTVEEIQQILKQAEEF